MNRLKTFSRIEVRVVGEKLGLPHDLVWRQPFPGPGLGVRVIGEVTAEKVRIFRKPMQFFVMKWISAVTQIK